MFTRGESSVDGSLAIGSKQLSSPQSSFTHTPIAATYMGEIAEKPSDIVASISPQVMASAGQFGTPIAQIFKTFVLSRNGEKLYIIDQHAVHERITYEAYKRAFFEKNVTSQSMMIPEMIQLSDVAFVAMTRFQNQLKELGLVYELFGKDTVCLNQVPSILSGVDYHQLILDLADELQDKGDGEPNALTDFLLEKLSTMACHNSIRAGRILNMEEMHGLLNEMENNPVIAQCNHGRPTYIELSKEKLEKMFERS